MNGQFKKNPSLLLCLTACIVVILYFQTNIYAESKNDIKSAGYIYKKFPRLNPDSTVSVKSPRGAMIRSIIFPGWGQWYNGKKLKSLIIFSAEAGCVAGYIIQNNRFNSSTTDIEREFYRDDRNKFIWWISGVILYSMLDSFVDAYLYGFNADMDINIEKKNSGSKYFLNLRFSIPEF